MATICLAHRTRYVIALLAVVLSIGLATRAQDGDGQFGRQAIMRYQLRMPTAEQRICLDQKSSVPLSVRAVQLISGDPDVGAIRVIGVDIEATADSPIVDVQITAPSLNLSADEPVIGSLTLKGLVPGTANVTVDVTVRDSHRFGFVTPVQFHTSVTVRVIPCEYRIDIGSVWTTTLDGAFALISANVVNIHVVGSGGVLTNDPRFVDNPPLNWNFTINRIRGCEIGMPEVTQSAPRVRVEVLDDTIAVTVNYAPLDPDDDYYIEACRVNHPLQHSAPCYEHPDGVCFAWEGRRHVYRPDPLEGSTLLFGLDGGSVPIQQYLRHSQGVASGNTNITITPVRR